MSFWGTLLAEYAPKVTDSPSDKIILSVGIILGLSFLVALVIIIHDSGRNR